MCRNIFFTTLIHCIARMLAETDVTLLWSHIHQTMQAEGLDSPSLESLLQQFLQVRPKDHEALGALALWHVHAGDLVPASHLMKRLKKAPKAPKETKSLAARFAAAIATVLQQRHSDGIAMLRRIASSLAMESEESKPSWHHGVETESLLLAVQLDQNMREAGSIWQGKKNKKLCPRTSCTTFVACRAV